MSDWLAAFEEVLRIEEMQRILHDEIPHNNYCVLKYLVNFLTEVRTMNLRCRAQAKRSDSQVGNCSGELLITLHTLVMYKVWSQKLICNNFSAEIFWQRLKCLVRYALYKKRENFPVKVFTWARQHSTKWFLCSRDIITRYGLVLSLTALMALR